MKILIAGDVFPPRCGGAGWSAYYLARALRAAGHTIAVVRPRFDAKAGRPGVRQMEYDGFTVIEAVVPEPGHAPGRLYARNVAAPGHLRRTIARVAARQGSDLIHAQHALTVPAAVGAADLLARRRGRRVPVVATVRDYWPLSYYSTRQVVATTRGAGAEIRESLALKTPAVPIRATGARALAAALWQAEGPGSVRHLPLVPLWEAATRARRAALLRADAVIAVSHFVADALLAGGAVMPDRLHVIPNLVDLPHLDSITAGLPPLAALGLRPEEPFLLFAGKLEPSKGPQLLPPALWAAGLGDMIPLVFAGSGPLRPLLEDQGLLYSLDLRFSDWLDNADVLRLMRHATLLLFPSAWDEPLSRVLLEACGVGAMILALNTGGTPDILTDGANGRLMPDMAGFAAALPALLGDPTARARLAAGARATAETRFAAPVVAAQVEALYRAVVDGR